MFYDPGVIVSVFVAVAGISANVVAVRTLERSETSPLLYARSA